MALKRADLTGVKNGVNTTFTLPDLPLANSEVIIFNTSALYKVVVSPGVTQYTLSGQTVTLGLAPASTDDLWAYYEI